MKTEKYTVEVENLELEIICPIDISKAEFKKQLKYLRDKTKEVACDIKTEELPLRTTDTECYTIYEHSFVRGCSITTLSRRVCKEGYCFKRKGEK